MKHIVTGILAHVDAGKTTCIESMLYTSKTIRKLGRVDHQDAYLDYDSQERERGITIYSKEAHFRWKNSEVYLIDTPGHVDFSSENGKKSSSIRFSHSLDQWTRWYSISYFNDLEMLKTL